MPYSPFNLQRDMMGLRLFRGAGVFGQQSGGFLSASGQFDPNLEQSMRNRAYGQATEGLGLGLAQMASDEANWMQQEEQLKLQREMFQAQKDAAKDNVWDYVKGIGSFLPGVGSIFKGLAAMKYTGMFGGKGDSSDSTSTKETSDNVWDMFS
jgi:hypothetical protein